MPHEPEPPKGVYNPSEEQLLNHKRDRGHIDKALRYRNQFEPAWKHNIEKWNMVAPPGLEGTPNYVVPITRLATHTGVVSMRQSLFEITPIPEGGDEKKLSYMLREASAHCHRMCNMEGVMDYGIVDFAVIGNMVLESYVKVPFKAKRVPILNDDKEPTGKFKTVWRRDWSRPKIGTRSRSPWECAFDPGARIPSEIRYCWFQDRLTWAEFEEQYVNKPDNDYINLKCVPQGAVYTFNEGGDLERTKVNHDKIVIDHYQNELEDCWRIYANGVLIWDLPLSSVHCHGKITLSLIPNHHKYDSNLKTHALYGAGDPELLSDLDDLINAATNMYILNYKQKNTYVVGVEGALDVDEIDFTSGHPIHGKVNVQSLGAADLPEWEAFKNNLEEWAIQIVKKNYRRLEGEVAKTAYEAAQKKSDENKGMEYQIKKAEASGMYEYARKHISDIMEHLPIEEWEDVLDEDHATVKELLKSGQLGNADVIFGTNKVPLRVRYVEKIRTRGKVFKEKFNRKGVRDLEGLQEIKSLRGQDGWLAASKEYIQTREWRLFKRVPDIYLVGKTMLGQDDLTELGKLEQLLGILERIALLMTPSPTGGPSPLELLKVEGEKIAEKGFDKIGIPREEFSKSETEEKISKVKQGIEKAKAMRNQLLNPRANVEPPQVSPAVSGAAAVSGSGAAPQARPPSPGPTGL